MGRHGGSMKHCGWVRCFSFPFLRSFLLVCSYKSRQCIKKQRHYFFVSEWVHLKMKHGIHLTENNFIIRQHINFLFYWNLWIWPYLKEWPLPYFLLFCHTLIWYPVLLPGKSHGQRSLVGCSPWGREESDTTERLHFHFSLSCIGEGNGNPIQCSCLENPGTAEPGWLPSMGSYRVGHDWSDLAVAAAAYGILVPWPGIKPMSPALAVWSLNQWTFKEIPISMFLRVLLLIFFLVPLHTIVRL